MSSPGKCILARHRVASAFLLTPLIVGIAVALTGMAEDNAHGHFAADALFVVVVLSVVIAVFALPLFLVLRALNWLRWFHAVAVGASCGAIPCLLIGIDLRGALAAAAAGSAVGLLFWFLALYRNPRYTHRDREPT